MNTCRDIYGTDNNTDTTMEMQEEFANVSDMTTPYYAAFTDLTKTNATLPTQVTSKKSSI